MKKILILDIETTGFLKQGGKIVEVGIVSLDLDTGDKKILFDEVMHERPMTKQHVDSSWIVQNKYMTTEEIQSEANTTIAIVIFSVISSIIVTNIIHDCTHQHDSS